MFLKRLKLMRLAKPAYHYFIARGKCLVLGHVYDYTVEFSFCHARTSSLPPWRAQNLGTSNNVAVILSSTQLNAVFTKFNDTRKTQTGGSVKSYFKLASLKGHKTELVNIMV